MDQIKRLMRKTKRLSLGLLMVALFISLSGQPQAASALPADMPAVGMVCTTNPTSTFTLTTREGYITMPDGNIVYMWGFSSGADAFQHPSPTLCVNEGDLVTIVLNNTLDEDVSLIFPGQADVMANGQISQPQFAVTGEMLSLAPVATAGGGTMTYSFVATRPGTYMYKSGTEPAKQIDMGLYGALVVRPASNVYDGAGNLVEAYVYNDVDTRYTPEEEYLIIISQLDPELHVAVEQGLLYNMNNYTPRYWNYNGRSFPDTIADNGVGWLSAQPYGSLIYIHPLDMNQDLPDGSPNPAYHPYPAVIRYLNLGTLDYTHHPHGNHGRLIAWDGHLLKSPDGVWDMSSEEFSVTISPGQTMDSLFAWADVEHWNPTDNPIPVVIPQLVDLSVGQFYSGSPYLGQMEALPVGTTSFNQCGEYYHIAHNHSLHQITAWGVVLSGHITFARIDPPLPNECLP